MSLSLRWAGRELRSGVKGFRIFLACLALGVAAIAAAGSTAEAFRRGLASESREILGGDIALTVQGRRIDAAERARLAKVGRITDTVRVRAMTESGSGERRLAEVRGIDAAYPLAGTVGLSSPAPLVEVLRPGALPGAVVEQALLDRLSLKIGDPFLIGETRFQVRAVLTEEPDRLATGFALGPRVLVRLADLEAARLVEGDSLFAETVRIALPERTSLAEGRTASGKALKTPAQIRDRTNATAGLGRLIERLEYFLAFIGVASLVAGGLGVSGAVSTYLETRKPSIAVLKSLGAEGPLIRNVFLIQIGALALLGIVIGLAVGAAAPLALGAAIRSKLTVPALFGVYPEPLLKAAAFGVLAAAAFSLAPLARARATPPAALFRKDLAARLKLGPELVGAVLASVGLIVVTVVTAPRLNVAAGLVAGVAVGFLILWLLGRGAAWSAGRLRALTHGSVRIGLANLSGPASAARTAAPAIGLGVALLAAIVLIQSTLLSEIRDVAPKSAPALVFTQVPYDRTADFDGEIAKVVGPLSPDIYRSNPQTTGRIVALKGKRVNREAIDRDQRWFFDRDMAVTAIGPAPPDANLSAGKWWRLDDPAPQIVLDERIAEAGGLKPGDRLTLSVLGRDLDLTLAGTRPVEWGQFGTSYSLVLNPAALAGANLPHVAILKANKAQELQILRGLARDFPTVNIISVREQLEAAAEIFDQLTWAVRGAAAIAGLAGLLVLAGAIAATARARAREAAILKVLGASRRQVLSAYVWEYGGVGAIAGLIGVGLGAIATYPIVTRVFEAKFSIDWAGLVVLLVGVAAVTGAGGLGAAFVALAKRPAPVLRSD
jgi:putative ABC transport system permease protein